MVLAVFRIVILAVSPIVPHDLRSGWRRAWITEIGHFATLLRSRGLKNQYVRARLWHHFVGAMRDAQRLALETPGMRKFRAAMRRPSFTMAMIALLLAAIGAGSRGFSITRAMLDPPFPEADRLVLISEGGVTTSERHPIPPALLDCWAKHTTTFSGLAGYQWDAGHTAWVTPNFFQVLGARPPRFLLRRIDEWKPIAGREDLGAVGRMKPGVSAAAAESELRDLAVVCRPYVPSTQTWQVQVMPLVARIQKPLYGYAMAGAVTSGLLLAAAGIGMRADRRRIGRIRGRYWAFFSFKSVSVPLCLTLAIWEFTRATSFTVTGGATFIAEPIFIWLVILAFAASVWWCLADQRVRCRACLQVLQYPVRIGSLGAVLFNHAGTELVCCEGHGSLYVPAISSDYVQRGGWTALDAEDITTKR